MRDLQDPPAAAGTAPRMSERRTAWLGAMLVGLGPVSLPLFAPSLPAISAHFGAGAGAGKAALTLYLAGYISMQLVAGPLSDRLGRRPVALGFALVFIAASCATLLAPDMDSFLAARLLQGVGASAGVSLGRAIVLDQFPGRRAVAIMTLISLILAVGPSLAPVMGGGMAFFGGWRATLVAMLLMGCGQFALIWLLLVETRARDRAAPPGPGLAALFGRMLASRRFVFATLCTAGATTAFHAQSVLLPFLLVDRLGHTELAYALVTLVISAFYICGNTLSRLIQRRRGVVAPVPVGVGLMAGAAGVYLAACAGGLVNAATVMLALSLSAAAGALIFPSMIPLALLPFRDRAGAAASMNMFLQLAIALGMAVGASLVADPAAGLALAFAVSAALVLSGWLVWRRLPDRLSGA